MNCADSCIQNYINGNLTDAKQQARRVRSLVIYQALRARYGKTEKQAVAIANYLKGKGSFQQAADAEIGNTDTPKIPGSRYCA